MRYSELTEASIPPAYGYWITPDGAILPVRRDHGAVAHEHGFSDPDEEYTATNNAMKAGWIRIIAADEFNPNEFCADFVLGLLTRRSVSAVRKIVGGLDPSTFIIHHHGVPGVERFDRAGPFLRKLNAEI